MLHFLVIEKSDCASTLNLQVPNPICSCVKTCIKIENIFFQHVLFIFIAKAYFIMFCIRIVMKLVIFNVEHCLMVFIYTECWTMNNYWQMEIALKFYSTVFSLACRTLNNKIKERFLNCCTCSVVTYTWILQL